MNFTDVNCNRPAVEFLNFMVNSTISFEFIPTLTDLKNETTERDGTLVLYSDSILLVKNALIAFEFDVLSIENNY